MGKVMDRISCVDGDKHDVFEVVEKSKEMITIVDKNNNYIDIYIAHIVSITWIDAL